jgi:hypothetical protein
MPVCISLGEGALETVIFLSVTRLQAKRSLNPPPPVAVFVNIKLTFSARETKIAL